MRRPFADRAASAHIDRFVLKGAMLATSFHDPLRATRDLNLLGSGDADAEGLMRSPGAPPLDVVVAVLADFLMLPARRAQDPAAVIAISTGGS